MSDSVSRPDPVSRRAAWLSTLIALPVAVVAGVIAFAVLGAHSGATASPKDGAAPSAASTAPVVMSAPRLSATHATMCLAFIAQLPVALRGLAERHVTAGPEQNAAFGDPAITVACGAPKAVVAPTDEVYPMSGVCWHAVTDPKQTVWTTVDREVPVAVTIPDTYQQPGQWANEFSSALIAAMPSIKTPNINC